MRAWIASVAAIVTAIAASIFAQQAPGPAPVFDVTSVKVNEGANPRGGRLSPGLFEQTNVTLNDLVRMAYGHEAMGGPNWADVERFDVTGKGLFDLSAFLPSRDGAPPRVYLMLQSLLADRFKLATHLTRIEQPVYALKLARDDGRLGDRLHRSDVNCASVLAAMAKGETPDVPPSARRPPCALQAGVGRIHGNAVTMEQLADALNGKADRPVVDQSGLTGYFDVDFDWGELEAGPSDRPPPRGSDHPYADEPIFSALRIELGLKLEATRAGLERVVIDHAEQPTQN